MSGPIVRSGASPQFSQNWENIFGKGKKSKASAVSTVKPKSTKKKAAKKTAKKGKK